MHDLGNVDILSEIRLWHPYGSCIPYRVILMRFCQFIDTISVNICICIVVGSSLLSSVQIHDVEAEYEIL